jgi:hypothetical protein
MSQLSQGKRGTSWVITAALAHVGLVSVAVVLCTSSLIC